MAEPQRLPLAVKPSNRDETTNKDARIVNGYVEQVSQEEMFVYKRPGTVKSTTYSTGVAAAGLGSYVWNGDIYAIFGGTLYKNNTSVGTGLDTTNGVYTFSTCLGATPKLYMTNAVKGYNYDPTNGLVAITDTVYTGLSLVKGAAYLDGYNVAMTTTAGIYTSAVNDPTTWPSTDFLTAQIEADKGVCLAKQMMDIIALKTYSTEFFYDAGNATGSPLGPQQGSKMSVGCRHADSVRSLEGDLYWVSQAKEGGISVYSMTNLRGAMISTPSIDRLLQDADFTTVYSWTFKLAGHKFYGVTLVNSNLTLVYDASSKSWSQWTDANGNYLPWVSCVSTSSQQVLFQHATDGNMYRMDLTYGTDNGSAIIMDIYTPNYDGGTRIRKYLNSMDVICDQATGSTLKVRVSDDDFQTWTNFRQVDLGVKRPRLTDCGTFRRRAWHFRHESPTPLRILSVELHLDMGTL